MAPSAPRMTQAEAQALCRVAHRESGVAIAPGKRAFLEMRIGRRLREIGCEDYRHYLQLLEGPGGRVERAHLVEALTTHTTAFFRERAHFEWLAEYGLPALLERGAGQSAPLTIWSAACSLGSEMWTAAMVTDRRLRGLRPGSDWAVIGTDISRRILRKAALAVFSADEIADLPEDFRRDYLLRTRAGPRPARFRIVPQLRSHARLAYANLVNLSPALMLTADVIFLRNVLIYFSHEDQRRVVSQVIARLRPGGYLLTGHSESLTCIPDGLRQVGSSIYHKE
ncbi:MAG: hypothetical protein JJT95_04660 [Pararhodobacter sp.]|nr:hypothetical protein [Pararhodobacter sp.]